MNGPRDSRRGQRSRRGSRGRGLGLSLLGLSLAACPGLPFGAPRVQVDPGGGMLQGACEAVACEAPVEARDTEALVEAIEAQGWAWLGSYSSGCLTLSPQIEVVGELTLRARDLAISTDCAERDDCRQAVTLSLHHDLEGARCEAEEEAGAYQGCGRVRLSSTTLRVRRLHIDTHPTEFNFVPVVQLEPGCRDSCPDNQVLCEANRTCAGPGGHCALCLGQSKEACACVDAEGELDEGAFCEVAVSGDVLCAGSCQSGVCTPDEPGAFGCP